MTGCAILTNFNIHDKTRISFCAAMKMQQSIDWFRVIHELKGRGWTLEKIGNHVDASKNTVHYWASGVTSPRFPQGVALIDLWSDVMSNPPVTNASASKSSGK